MKNWLFILSFLFFTNNLFCQNNMEGKGIHAGIMVERAVIDNYESQYSMEWEIINAGLAFGFSDDENGYYNPDGGALTFGTEIRYNLKRKQLSPGFQFTFSGWNRQPHGEGSGYHQNAFVFLLTTDYNYTKISPKFTPFGGLGVGYSIIREWESWTFNSPYNYNKSHFAISPRIGFEAFKRLRFTTEYMYLGHGNNFFNFRLGFVIGS